ncbi:MAG: methyltransferase [Chloroflexota bacterium]
MKQTRQNRRKQKKKPVSSTQDNRLTYYDWASTKVRVRGQAVPVFSKPGMSYSLGVDPAAQLLADQLDFLPGGKVLVLNCGAGLAAIGAAMLGARQIWLTDVNMVATEAAHRTLEANQVNNAELFVSSGTRHLKSSVYPIFSSERSSVIPNDFDAVLVRLPKGKQLALQYILDAFNALRPGGHLYLAGANEEGIKSILRHMELLFGSSVILGYRKGGRVVKAIRPDAPTTLPALFQSPWLNHTFMKQFTLPASLAQTTFGSNGQNIKICTALGVFAGEQLDQGTKHLLEHIQIGASENVLDLGCGNGILGVAAANYTKDGEVWLVDNDINAVEAALATVKVNKLTNCHVLLGDCATALSVPEQVLPEEPSENSGEFLSEYTPERLSKPSALNSLGNTSQPAESSTGPTLHLPYAPGGSSVSHQLPTIRQSPPSGFDVVVTNPPFHQGKGIHYDVATQFIQEGSQMLKEGGRFYLVANHFLNYEEQISATFGNCQTLYRGSRFKVLQGTVSTPEKAKG